MSNAILLHGTCDEDEYFNEKYPSLSNSHWFPWLQKQLLIHHIFTQTPEMPDAYKPNYQIWKQEFEKYTVNEDTILVGHSCGGGFLLRWLSENDVKVNKLILVAPWLDPDRSKTTDFFEFTLDPSMLQRINEAHLLVSDNDDEDIHTSVKTITEKLPGLNIHTSHGLGHFTYEDMKTNEFPELLKLITEVQ